MRFAGDYFGAPIATEEDGSELLKRFPELRDTFKNVKQSANAKNEPRLTGNVKGARAFAGFKTFEAPE